jgi:hypothetical protein
MPDRRGHIGKNVDDPWIIVLDVPHFLSPPRPTIHTHQ